MKHLHGKQLLALVYLAIVVVSIFRISVHPSNYTTPDSIAYLKQADFIKASWESSKSLTDLYLVKGTFTIWPLGYPTSIAAASIITGTSSLAASKIVNFVFLGLLLLLLSKLFGEKAWFVALPLLSYGSLEVIAETWSELPFLFFVFFICYLVLNENGIPNWSLALLLTSSLVLLFLFRYVGVIYFFVLAGHLIKHGINKDYKLASTYFLSLLAASCFVLWYFYENKTISGFHSGMPRLERGHKGVWGFSLELFQGIFNEFAIARNYFFRGAMDWLFILLTLVQLGVFVLLSKGRALLSKPIIVSKEVKTLLLFSISYLVGITIFKVFIPIDAFDFRILFPFSAPLFIGIFGILVHQSQARYFEKNAKWVIGFMLLSLVINLPKTYLLEALGLL